MSDAASFVLGVRNQALLAQALGVAASLGVADALAAGPLNMAELAGRCQAHADSLQRLLRLLASHGVFAEDETGRFSNTERSAALQSSVAGSLHAVLAGDFPPLVWSAYGQLEQAVRTGEVAFELAHGDSFFNYLQANPTANASFDEAMDLVAAAENPLIAAWLKPAAGELVVDVGGGQGGLLAAVLQSHTRARGLLFDQPQVIADPAALAAAGLLDRCEMQAGDFFSAIPADADWYLCKRILHDWDDKQALSILHTCRAAMKASARLAIIDAVMQPGNEPDPNKFLDLGIMALTGGRERSEADFKRLFASAGLVLVDIHPLPAPATLSIVEARPG
ncbi:MAG: methyltransferase [Gammaproteobacteria bacterium]